MSACCSSFGLPACKCATGLDVAKLREAKRILWEHARDPETGDKFRPASGENEPAAYREAVGIGGKLVGVNRKRVAKVDTSKMERGDPAWRRELGRNVRGMREAKGITRLQLASRLRWPVSTLVKLEAGELTPSEGQERDLARWVQGK